MNSLKVLYDYQIFDAQKIGGISRYFYALSEGLPSGSAEFAVLHSDNIYLRQGNRASLLPSKYDFNSFFPTINFRGKKKLWKIRNDFLKYEDPRVINKKYSIEKIIRGEFDVFHPTYYDPYFLEYLNDKPFVLTVHDMIHEKYPELFPLSDETISNKKTLIERANKIIAISKQTKKDIIELYGIDENRISIIYHGSDLGAFANRDNRILNIPQKYLLFTGSRTLYKNFYFFLESLKKIFDEYDELSLVCTGSAFSVHELNYFRNLGIENRIMHHYANDSELFYLYKTAAAFVFPSYYEGFGIPILEAFEAECPVLLANASCFPEIAETAAVYFNPKSSFEIQDACRKVLDSESFRNKLIENGRKQLKKFSWNKCSSETLAVYKTLI